jgi:2-phosphoglycerate kinase
MNENNERQPLIILIGGASGTGKTTLGKTLCSELGISHRMGSGFIREFAKSFVSRSDNPYLYNYSFRPHLDNISPFENLYKQSEVLKPGIEGCLQRAYDEGTSLLIEGVNIIPGLITFKFTTLFLTLSVDDYDVHYSRIMGNTHFKRKISEEDFKKGRGVQQKFVETAVKHNCPVIDVSQPDNTVNIVKSLLNQSKIKKQK